MWGTSFENTVVSRCSYQKKSPRVRLVLWDSYENTSHCVMRQSPNFCFKHWMTKLVLCGPVLLKPSSFQDYSALYNFEKKSFQHLFTPHTELTPTLRLFLPLGEKKSDNAVLQNGAPHCNLFRMQWFCNLPIWIISWPVENVLFVYTSIQLEVCLILREKEKVLIIANAKTVCKNLSVWLSQFLLNSWTICTL